MNKIVALIILGAILMSRNIDSLPQDEPKQNSNVIVLPHPIDTCEVVEEPYLHCKNGTWYDPSGSGDDRTLDLRKTIVYDKPKRQEI